MTDPRLAPLAVAFAEIGEGKVTPARLLAELPPDWCGHGTEIAHLNGVILRQHDCDHSDCIDREERLRKIEEAARDISRRTFVDDGVVAHVPFYKLYTLRQRLYGSDEEIIAALDALDGSE